MTAAKLWFGKQLFQPTTSEQTQLYDAQQSAIAAAMAATAANSNRKGYNDARKRRALEKKFGKLPAVGHEHCHPPDRSKIVLIQLVARAMGRAVAAIGKRQIAANGK